MDMRSLVPFAKEWDYCAVGERAAIVNDGDHFGLMLYTPGLRSLGYDFADAVEAGSREWALRVLGEIEAKTPTAQGEAEAEGEARIAAREAAAGDGEGAAACVGCLNGCSFCEPMEG